MASDVDSRPAALESVPKVSTDFGAFVIATLAHHRRNSPDTINQDILRRCINLAACFLITDTTINPDHGIATWFAGLSRLVDLVVVLHLRDDLQLETVNAASRACSECWTVAANWRGLDQCRSHVRELGGKLKGILDTNGRTYRGIYFLDISRRMLTLLKASAYTRPNTHRPPSLSLRPRYRISVSNLILFPMQYIPLPCLALPMAECRNLGPCSITRPNDF